jgi:hypothetical protein
MCRSSWSEPVGDSAMSASSCGAWAPIVRASPVALRRMAAFPDGEAPANTCFVRNLCVLCMDSRVHCPCCNLTHAA